MWRGQLNLPTCTHKFQKKQQGDQRRVREETLVAGAGGVLLLLLLLARNRSVDAKWGQWRQGSLMLVWFVVYRWRERDWLTEAWDYNFHISSVHVMKAKGHAWPASSEKKRENCREGLCLCFGASFFLLLFGVYIYGLELEWHLSSAWALLFSSLLCSSPSRVDIARLAGVTWKLVAFIKLLGVLPVLIWL